MRNEAKPTLLHKVIGRLTHLETSKALRDFDPKKFDFTQHTIPSGEEEINIWYKRLTDDTTLAIRKLSPKDKDEISLLTELQQEFWGNGSSKYLTNPVDLAMFTENGGSVLVAYNPDIGFNRDGWYGFVYGSGASNRNLFSERAVVNDQIRNRGVYFHLKVLQAYYALAEGHISMTWTFPPGRAPNAKENLEKLGAKVEEFILNAFGNGVSWGLDRGLPTHRFKVRWNLLDSEMRRNLLGVAHEIKVEREVRDASSFDMFKAYPIVDLTNINSYRANPQRHLLLQIPSDFSKDNLEEVALAQKTIEAVGSSLLMPSTGSRRGNKPLYSIERFISAHDSSNTGYENYYVLVLN